jgi:hypothetical protein
VLGEVPLAAAAIIAAPILAERTSFAGQGPAANERVTAVHARNQKPLPEVVPFTKDVKEFTRQELMQTAEKVQVEGTTLREMSELGRLDEPGLRRVVGEFLKGGDVTRAVSKEIKEKELQYEQDPNLRHRHEGEGDPRAAQAGGMIIGGLLGTGHVSPQLGIGTASSTDASSQNAQPVVSNSQGPQASPEALRQIRNKQLAAVTTTTVLVVLGIVIAYIMTG